MSALRFLVSNEGIDVFDDFGDGVVVLHHFLVMASALIGGPCFNSSANLKVDFDDPAHHVICFKQMGIFLQKFLVFDVLLECPCAYVEHFLFLLDFIQALSSLEEADLNLGHLVRTFTFLLDFPEDGALLDLGGNLEIFLHWAFELFN